MTSSPSTQTPLSAAPLDETRRHWLRLGGTALAGLSLLTCARAATPHAVGHKFFADGRVKPFGGNTIICHLPQQDAGYASFDALLDVYRDFPHHPFMAKMAPLPPSSYHMTVLGCADDEHRKPGLWPHGVPMDAPMAECDALLMQRLTSFSLDCELPLRMRVDDQRPGPGEGLRIEMAPVDAAEERKLRRLRDQLADLTGIRAPDHDRFTFHISLAYLVGELHAEEREALERARRAWHTELARKVPVWHLGAPEFCTFDDMFAFRRRMYLV
ncbi:DUF1868 domain-containing protein [Luteibacter sp. PPL201]|uniref:DUF1868 domain-containing protein n=1 Tax=Luteibacter sahnii TaxID=3021977 RepID=A0ABT6BC45_9GAMM